MNIATFGMRRLSSSPSDTGSPSLPEVHRSIHIPRASSGSTNARRALAFAGPGYLVAVGYMDPGNWATSIAGGSKFGYSLLAVIFLSNLMAMAFQIIRIKNLSLLLIASQ